MNQSGGVVRKWLYATVPEVQARATWSYLRCQSTYVAITIHVQCGCYPSFVSLLFPSFAPPTTLHHSFFLVGKENKN